MNDKAKEIITENKPSALVEMAKKFNSTIELATPAVLERSLNGDKNFTVRSGDNLFYGKQFPLNYEQVDKGDHVVSTEGDPAVIYLNGARFCSLLLAKDDKGNAVGLHEPIHYAIEDDQAAREQLDPFFEKVKEIIGQNEGFLLISGANNITRKERVLGLLGDSLKETHLTLASLFIRTKTTLVNFAKELIGKDKPILPNAVKNISGLIYIPGQIDKEGIDRILLVDRYADMAKFIKIMFRT